MSEWALIVSNLCTVSNIKCPVFFNSSPRLGSALLGSAPDWWWSNSLLAVLFPENGMKIQMHRHMRLAAATITSHLRLRLLEWDSTWLDSWLGELEFYSTQ